MSGVGKTTLGFHLAQDLGYLFLDSDVVRNFLGIAPDFSRQGRLNYHEALRNHVRELQYRGNNLVVASITPFEEMRKLNQEELLNYVEVYLTCELDKLISRDPKDLYKQALSGELHDFTGISSEFEEPKEGAQNRLPDLVIDTGFYSEEEACVILVNMVKKYLRRL